MPLSDREQQILQEIEQQLRSDDPAFGNDLESSKSTAGRNVRLGIVLFVVGLVMLVAFFVTGSLLVGVAAFAAMVGGIVVLVGGIRRLLLHRDEPGPKDRLTGMLARWEKRLRDRYKRI